MKIITPRFLNYLLFFLLLFISCNTENVDVNKDDLISNQLQNRLKLELFNNKNLFQNITVNWQMEQRLNIDDLEIYQIPATEKNESELISSFLKDRIKYQIFAIKNNTSLEAYFIEIYSDLKSSEYPFSIDKLNNFSGVFNVFDFNGSNLGTISIKGGRAKNLSDNQKLTQLIYAINSFEDNINSTSKIPLCDSTYTQTVLQITARYDVWTFEGRVIAENYLGTTSQIITTILPYPCDGIFDKEAWILQRQSQFNYRSGAAPSGLLIEQGINDDGLDPCPKSILGKLKNGTNSDISTILETLGASKVINIKIKSDASIPRPATSFPDGTNNYSILVSSNYTSATQLFRASNLLHEIMHCYFFSLIDEQTATKNPNVFKDFPVLFQKFVDKTYPGSKDAAHHDQIAQKYVRAIGAALQEFQTGIPVASNQEPLQMYTDLAWGGLQEAPIFAQKFPEGSADYSRIKGRYDAESVGGSVNGQTAIGIPCN